MGTVHGPHGQFGLWPEINSQYFPMTPLQSAQQRLTQQSKYKQRCSGIILPELNANFMSGAEKTVINWHYVASSTHMMVVLIHFDSYTGGEECSLHIYSIKKRLNDRHGQ